MSLKKPALLFSTAAISLIAHGADPIYTDPVGFVKLGNPSSNQVTPAVPANTDVRLSIPLESELLFSGRFSSNSGDQITVSGTPEWSVDQWAPTTSAVYSLIVTSGTENGLRGYISSNTANTLDVDFTTLGSPDNLVNTDNIEIRRAWTLKTFFESSSITPGTRILLFDGATNGINLSATTITVWTGSEWRYSLGGSGNADQLLLTPGESFILRTGTLKVDRLVAFGDVPLSQHRMSISKFVAGLQQDTTFGFFRPVPEAVGTSNAGFSPGDRILAFNNISAGQNKAAEQIVVYTGVEWRGVLGLTGPVNDSFFLNPGVGYVYQRSANAPVGDTDWADREIP